MSDEPRTPTEGGPSDDDTPVEDVAPRALPEQPVLAAVIESSPNAVWRRSAGQDVVVLPKDEIADFAAAAHEAGFEMLADLTAVDYLGVRRVRFEVVVNLLSIEHALRLRILCPIDGDEPRLPTLVDVYPGANFYEREVYDMFGIVFDGHPDMTRILMPDDWEGHPLRKDFGVGAVPVQFKAANKVT